MLVKFGFDVGWLQKGVSGLNNVIIGSNEGLETKKDKIDKMTGMDAKFPKRNFTKNWIRVQWQSTKLLKVKQIRVRYKYKYMWVRVEKGRWGSKGI